MNILKSVIMVPFLGTMPAISTIEQLRLLNPDEIYTGSDIFYKDWNCFPSDEDAPLIERGNPYLESNREIYTIRGYSFEPREFWRQSIKKQMLYLKEPILKHNLVKIIDERYEHSCIASSASSSFANIEDAYPEDFVKRFNRDIYLRIQDFIRENDLPSLSEHDFYESLKKFLLSTSEIYNYPLLIMHFSPFLCPRWSRQSVSHPELSNMKFPSKFEMWLMEEESK